MISSRDSYPVVSRTGPTDHVPACLNYLLEYPGYRRELGYSRYQMLPKPETGDAAIYRHRSGAAEDLVRLRTPGAKAKSDTGQAALYIQLSTYPF